MSEPDPPRSVASEGTSSDGTGTPRDDGHGGKRSAPVGSDAELTDAGDAQPVDFTGRRTRWIVGGVLLALVAMGVVLAGGEGLRAWLVASEDADPPPWTDADAVWDGVDLAALHADLLLAAFVASQQPGLEFDARLRAVRSAVAPRPELAEAVDAMFGARAGMPLADALAAEAELISAWNARMAEAGRPWALQLPLNPQSRAASLYALSYWVAADLDAQVGDLVVPVRFASRIDGLNVVEAYMGHANARDEMAWARG